MSFSRRNLLALVAAAAVPGLPVAVCAQLAEGTVPRGSAERLPYTELDEVQDFIDETASKTGLSQDFIEDVLSQASYSKRSEQLMTPRPRNPGAPAGTARANWARYRARMVDSTRIKGGIRFLEENEAAFDQAEDQFGVPRDIVAAIIGIETAYGKNQGRFRVLDVLCTLSFDYKRRAEYFKTELVQFLLLVHEQKLDPTAVLGSYAGALGMGQFMPSSVRRFALDFDGDGKIDLFASAPDAIGSVANYLAKNGWVRGLPTAFSCEAEPDADLSLVKGGVSPEVTLEQALKGGFVPDFEIDLPGNEPLLIVDLPAGEKDGAAFTEYRLGTRNFQTILTYNRSYFYASAVSDLALEIEAASMQKAASAMQSSGAAS